MATEAEEISTETEISPSENTGGGGLFANLKVMVKIMGGFGLVLLILAGMAGYSFNQLVYINKDVNIYTDHVEEAGLAGEIESQFYHMQMYVREYVATGNEEDVDKAHEVGAELAKLIAEAKVHIVEPDQAKKVAAIEHAFEVYSADFEKAVVLEHDFLKLIHDVLDPTGEKFIEDLDIMLEEVIKEGNADAATLIYTAREHGLKAELYTNILLGRKDNSFAEKVSHEFAEVHAALTALGKVINTAEEKKLHAEMTELLDTYEKTFEKVLHEEHQINELIHGEMAAAAKEIADDALWLEEEISAEEEEVRDETLEIIQTVEEMLMIVSILAVLIGGILAFFIGRAISKPMVTMTGAMSKLAEGDLEIEVPAQGRKDEIGEMAATVQVFKDNAIRVKQMEAEQKEAEKRAEAEKKAAMNKMADDFETAVGGVVDQVSSAATEMQSSSEAMAATAEETSQQSATVAAASEQASANVQTVASAAEELSSSIAEISRQVGQSSQITASAVVQAEQTNEKVQGLAVAANKIGEVVALITDIADQTNLLALNATIEAARAGDAGKGFAVVASEVKNLANQTGKATDEIGNQIAEIQSATAEAVSAIEAIGKTISEVDEIATTIASAVEEQGAATQEIARNVEQAATGTNEVSSNIGGVSQAAGETGAAATQIQSAANELSVQSETLRTEVDKFLANVRTA